MATTNPIDSSTTKVRFDFSCGPKSTFTIYHDLPSLLIRASTMGLTPPYRQLYFQTMAPLMKQHEERCTKASQEMCAVCELRPTKSVLMTPMSYLHLKDEPRVSVLVTPVCEDASCHSIGKTMVKDLVDETVGDAVPKASVSGFGMQPTARNAHCPCGSSRKYKKCCGSQAAMDDVD